MELPEGPPLAGIHSEDTSTNSFVKNRSPHTGEVCSAHSVLTSHYSTTHEHVLTSF